jgi:hypothetical protein
VFISPEQIGPTMRVPQFFSVSVISLSIASPSAPVSEKPAASLMMNLTPLSQHFLITCEVFFAGMMITASSISSGISAMSL